MQEERQSEQDLKTGLNLGGKQQRSLMSEVESEKSRICWWRDDKEKVNRQNFFSIVILLQVQNRFCLF